MLSLFHSFHQSPTLLSIQRQRTVYRLTLVKAWNVEEMQAYSELIALSQPDFIEVKVVFSSMYLNSICVFFFFSVEALFKIIVVIIVISLLHHFPPVFLSIPFFGEIIFPYLVLTYVWGKFSKGCHIFTSVISSKQISYHQDNCWA